MVDGKFINLKFGILPTFSKRIVLENVAYVYKSLNLISDAGLTSIEDSNSIIKPKNCQIEQTAFYFDASDEIHVVEEIWNAFDNVNKAGLLVHEALYNSMRQSGETNSDRVRLVVGQAFSGSKFQHILDGVPETVTVCGTEDGASK